MKQIKRMRKVSSPDRRLRFSSQLVRLLECDGEGQWRMRLIPNLGRRGVRLICQLGGRR